jgi:D-3-phosphoglycerate dehydrogenase
VEKIVEINGYELELPLSEHLIVFSYSDRPGIVASYGSLLGDAGVNIAGLQIARDSKKGTALSVLSIDSPVDDSLIEALRTAIGADKISTIDIDAL